MGFVLSLEEREYLTSLIEGRIEGLKGLYKSGKVTKEVIAQEVFIIISIVMKLELDLYKIRIAFEGLLDEMMKRH